jgi:hypothetical protein
MTLVHVEFDWSDEFGRCYDCGLPAAYETGTRSTRRELLCSVCAAQHAADGEVLTYLFREPYCNHDPVAVANGVCECGETIGTYSLAEIRNGTGWAAGVRFRPVSIS